MGLRAEEQLHLSVQDVGELLTLVTDLVVAVASSGVEREEVRLDYVVLTASHHLVDDSVAAPDAPNGRRAVADDFDGPAIASGLIAVGEEIGDVQAEVPGDLLQPAQR